MFLLVFAHDSSAGKTISVEAVFVIFTNKHFVVSYHFGVKLNSAELFGAGVGKSNHIINRCCVEVSIG